MQFALDDFAGHADQYIQQRLFQLLVLLGNGLEEVFHQLLQALHFSLQLHLGFLARLDLPGMQAVTLADTKAFVVGLLVDLLTNGLQLLEGQGLDLFKRHIARSSSSPVQRKELEDKIKKTASERVRNAGAIPAAIMVWDKSFHTGVIGIVAQRMVEEFFRPAAIMGQDSPGIFKGSVRGIPGFSVIEALSMVQEHLMKFGGHAGAGGFSVAADKVDAFAEAFRSVCAERTATLGSSPLVKADTEVTLAELSIELVEELRRFSPFGIGNSSPQLLVKRLKVGALTVMKGCHLKARLSDGKKSLTGMLWKHAEHPALRQGAEVDVVFRLDINEFKGERELQAHLEAILPAA